MLDKPQDTKTENLTLSSSLIGLLDEKAEDSHKIAYLPGSKMDTASPHLPFFFVSTGDGKTNQSITASTDKTLASKALVNGAPVNGVPVDGTPVDGVPVDRAIAGRAIAGNTPGDKTPADKTVANEAQPDKKDRGTDSLIPNEDHTAPVGKQETIQLPELANPFGEQTQKALSKDADLYAPVHNPDGSTTYTVVQTGITDRAGKDNEIDYYRRNVEVTVPADSPSLEKCKYLLSPREVITKDEYDKLLERDKTVSKDVELYAHGVSATDTVADEQALALQLSSGIPTINLDWTSGPRPGKNPIKALESYDSDTKAAKRANDNKQFQGAIDDTVKDIGADNTDLIGFSHGSFFDTRYLEHRLDSKLPLLNTVLLAHPDVPISAPELEVNGRPELLKDAANHSYVIGNEHDLALKEAELATWPGTPTFEGWSKTDARLGNDSAESRSLIEKEGAVPIEERNRNEFCLEHFLNYAGISELLNSGKQLAPNDLQSAYNTATDIGRTNLRYVS